MDRTTARRATLLIMALFLVQPLAIGGWLALIPHVKEGLGLSKGGLALALLGMPLALLPALQLAGALIGRIGLRPVFLAAFPLQAVAVVLPLLAWNQASLFLALACLGATTAFLEVGINVYAGRVEKRAGVIIMNRCHGFWALGLMAGSGAVALAGGGPPLGTLAVLAAASAGLGLVGTRALPRLRGAVEEAAPLLRRRLSDLPRALFPIAIAMLFVTMAEGAMGDWAAVYLDERLAGQAGDSVAGLGVTVFAGFLAGGRFLGDMLNRLIGPVALGRMTVAVACLGLGLLLPQGPVWLSFLGFALVGFGVSAAYPLGVSAVAALDERYEAPNIALMSIITLCGFVIGPPMIGLIADAWSLALGLAALLPGLALAFWLMGWMRPRVGGESS